MNIVYIIYVYMYILLFLNKYNHIFNMSQVELIVYTVRKMNMYLNTNRNHPMINDTKLAL